MNMSDFKWQPQGTYKDFFVNTEAELQKLLHEYHIQVEALTRDQLAKAIIEAIKCGDFMKHVVHGTVPVIVKETDGKFTFQECSFVDYIPARQHEQLLEEIRALQAQIEALAHQ